MGSLRSRARCAVRSARRKGTTLWAAHCAPRTAHASAASLLFLLASALLIARAFFVAPAWRGDGLEYYQVMQALERHGTPEVRRSDAEAAAPVLRKNVPYFSRMEPYLGLVPTRTGQHGGWHFWLYPLLALPAKALLRLAGGNPFAAFHLTNCLLFVFALGIALFKSQAPLFRRLVFTALAAVGPVLWYLNWSSPELFTWSFIVISLTLLGNGSYCGAVLCASLAATQNPPVLFLVLYLLFVSWRECGLRRSLPAGAAALLSLLPNLSSLYYFGVPNLIAARAGADFRLISWARTCSFLTDLNQGMLPYVPLLLLLAAMAIWRALRMRSAAGIGAALTLLLMILFSEPTVDWNADSSGMMRYAVWIVPMLAWLVAGSLRPTKTNTRLVIAAVAVQAAIFCQYTEWGTDALFSYVHQTPLARCILHRAPALYDPDPEIFCDRQLHRDTIRGSVPQCLPVAFTTRQGVVTKILADAATLPALPSRYQIAPAYFAQVSRRYRGRTGMFYLTPPHGAVRSRE